MQRARSRTDEKTAGAQALAEFGRIDILVNNAGISGGNATTWKLDPAMWRRVVEVNLIAPYLTCVAATRSILVNALATAAAKTAIFVTMKPELIAYMLSKIPMNRFVEVHEIAAGICWLASEDCPFTTGSVLDVSGGGRRIEGPTPAA